MSTPTRQITLHFLHVGIKPDGQHAIRLVKDQYAQRLEIKRMPQQVVKHASRRADQHLGPAAQGFYLFFVPYAAIDGYGTQAGAFKQRRCLVFHLHGQFAGRHQHQRLGGLQLRIKMRQHGQQITAGLSAAGTGLHHDVASCQQIGQGQRLHRHELRPAGPRAGRAQHLRHIVQPHARQGVFRLADGK